MHLWCAFYLSRPLFGEAQLDGLQSVINEGLPAWSSGLRAAKHEDSPRLAVGDDRLYDCIYRVAAPKRGLGSAALFGAYRALSFFLSHCDKTLPSELNEMALEVYGTSTLEGQTVSAWARQAFEALVARLPVRYANAYLDEEYRAKNMIDDETGVRAIGANIAYATPGLYWLNFFGAPYLDLMGRERLLAAPAYEAKAVDDGVLIALDAAADAWQTPDYRRRQEAVIAHLGKQCFFSRHDPNRQTVAPDFRAYQQRARDA